MESESIGFHQRKARRQIMRHHIVACSLAIVLCATGLASGDVFKVGGDRLVTMQNNDGGWDWPLSDRSPKSSNAPNILAPTSMGLVQAYLSTGDPNQLAALEKAGS